MSLRRSSISSSSPSLLFPPVYPSSHYAPRQPGKKWMDHFVPLLLEIRPFFPRIVDESIGHPVAFCPLFAATLSMYHGCRRRAEAVCEASPMTHEREQEKNRERESGFDFISRMNMQPRDSHHHNYRAVASVASLH